MNLFYSYKEIIQQKVKGVPFGPGFRHSLPEANSCLKASLGVGRAQTMAQSLTQSAPIAINNNYLQ